MVDTCEQVLAEITNRARDRWNAQADEWNQWPELGADEKQELIEAEKEVTP